MRSIIIRIIVIVLLLTSTVYANTFYVRTDGGAYGTDATHCNGQTDTAFTGNNGPDCAVKHIFELLPPRGYGDDDSQVKISSGDTVIIKQGSYKIGYTPGEYDQDNGPGTCNADQYCDPSAIPGGLDAAHPTRILGEGWDTGCTNPPELFGTHGVGQLLNVDGGDNIEIRCLEITDHEQCVDNANHATRNCPDYAGVDGDWGVRGLYLYNSDNLNLYDLNIHGMANTGIQAGGLSNIHVENTIIRANGFAGIDVKTSCSGDLMFYKVRIDYNGCIESYPDGDPEECWGQEGGGYGDGVGLEKTTGNWVWKECAFNFNTQDGLDNLYIVSPGTETVESCHAEGNAGNQIKVSGATIVIRNTVAIGNCMFFDGNPIASPTEWTSADNCRAGGDAYNIALARDDSTGHHASFVNNTTVWESNYGIWLSQSIATCDGTETAIFRNNIWQNKDASKSYMGVGCAGLTPDVNNSVIYNTFGTPCDGQSDCIVDNPDFIIVDFDTETFNLNIQAGSPAINYGLPVGTVVGDTEVPATDYYGNNRLGDADAGAIEYIPIAQDSVAFKTDGACSMR